MCSINTYFNGIRVLIDVSNEIFISDNEHESKIMLKKKCNFQLLYKIMKIIFCPPVTDKSRYFIENNRKKTIAIFL